MTPIVFGLASELFITLCRITPAQASPIPAKTPAIIRGSLILNIRSAFTEEESFPVNTLKTSCGFIYTLPDRILKNIIKISGRAGVQCHYCSRNTEKKQYHTKLIRFI